VLFFGDGVQLPQDIGVLRGHVFLLADISAQVERGPTLLKKSARTPPLKVAPLSLENSTIVLSSRWSCWSCSRPLVFFGQQRRLGAPTQAGNPEHYQEKYSHNLPLI
jgi:hypothetical protein